MTIYPGTIYTNSASTTTSTILYNGDWNNSVYVSPGKYVVSYGEAVFPASLPEASALPESDMDWLKRRVDEISWQLPA